MVNLCRECGMDEAGRGPVFGPMVVAIVCGDSEKMREIGARDSKSLSPKARERILSIIEKEKCFLDYSVITASELNERMCHQTLNEIEYGAYLNLILRSPEGSSIQVDSFDVIEERLQERLRHDSGREVICRHSGDRIFPLVSAASIVAKVVRDREVEEIREKYGDIGSGYPADPKTQEFLRKCFQNGWNIDNIVRKRWKTYIRMKSDNENGRLF
jgi:ribonuclease HII